MISIKRARCLLGKTGGKMTDKEIVKLQGELHTLSDILIDQYIEDKKKGKSGQKKE